MDLVLQAAADQDLRAAHEIKLYKEQAMLVETLMAAVRARLVTVADDAPLIEAAKLLRAGPTL